MTLISFKIYLKFPKNLLQLLQHLFPKVIHTRLIRSPQLVLLSSKLYTRLQYRSKSESHRGQLVCGVSFTYAGSWEEGMPHWVQIARLKFCDSNISQSPNCIEVDSCAGCLLLILEVEKRECCTESKSHGCRVVCGFTLHIGVNFFGAEVSETVGTILNK